MVIIFESQRTTLFLIWIHIYARKKKLCIGIKLIKTTVSVAGWFKAPVGKQWVAVSIPGGDIYFHLNFSIASCSSQLGEVSTSEIKNDIA